MEKIRVLVADDHPVFQEGLCRLLADEDDLEVVARPTNGQEAIRLAKELVPDVAILDVVMPEFNGLEVAEQVKTACPGTAVLMVSAYDYQSYLIGSLRAGASGYLLKSASPRELISAVRAVHAGQAVFGAGTARKLIGRLAADKAGKSGGYDELPERELEVLKLAGRGLTNRQIGAQLGISGRTVQTHMANLFERLRATSRTDAVLEGLRQGWLTLDDVREKVHT